MKKPVHLEDRAFSGTRQISPTAQRNSAPIAQQISPKLKPGQRVLEIASGTGQHAMAILANSQNIVWQPSDPDAQSRASLESYQTEAPGALLSPLNINVTDETWWDSLPVNYDHIYCANMIHIAPSGSVLGLAKGAAEILPKGGHVFLYGPFLFGAESAPSNLAFSERLKQRDPDWGVRELDFVKPIFASCGFTLTAQIAMPANNHILDFTRH